MLAYFRFCTIAILLFIGISTCAAKARQSSQSNEPESTKAYITKWVGLSTPHFELYTTNDPQAALEAVQRLEMVHSFFRQAGANAGLFGAVPEAEVQVIAFRSAREYSAHRVNPTACAYYQGTRRGDYIIMQHCRWKRLNGFVGVRSCTEGTIRECVARALAIRCSAAVVSLMT